MSVSARIDDHMEDGLNLGGLVDRLLPKLGNKPIKQISLQVANSVWYGSFTVPGAVGFSTPLSLCKGGTISVVADANPEGNSPTNAQYLQWKNIFGFRCVRIDDTFKFTSSHQECTICSEPYQVGDELIRLEFCGHVFHQKCQKKWALSKKSEKELIKAMIYEERIKSNCPVCNALTS